MAVSDPSVVVEIDIEQNIVRAYNPLFPDMHVEHVLEADVGGFDYTAVMQLKKTVREEYKAKYGI